MVLLQAHVNQWYCQIGSKAHVGGRCCILSLPCKSKPSHSSWKFDMLSSHKSAFRSLVAVPCLGVHTHMRVRAHSAKHWASAQPSCWSRPSPLSPSSQAAVKCTTALASAPLSCATATWSKTDWPTHPGVCTRRTGHHIRAQLLQIAVMLDYSISMSINIKGK